MKQNPGLTKKNGNGKPFLPPQKLRVFARVCVFFWTIAMYKNQPQTITKKTPPGNLDTPKSQKLPLSAEELSRFLSRVINTSSMDFHTWQLSVSWTGKQASLCCFHGHEGKTTSQLRFSNSHQGSRMPI